MPFIEVVGPPLDLHPRQVAARGLTEALVGAYGISPDIVTVYFLDVAPGHYAHAGEVGIATGGQRAFIKVFAFPRPVEKRREAARTLSAAATAATGWAGKDVIVYFFDVAPDAAAHAGVLQSDV